MKIDKIYTRTGDDGMTSMGDGSRLPKFSLRVTAIGDVDEANAAIGVAALHLRNPAAVKLLKQIQNDLFD
ncbi:MAG: ATP:cob(I)alamin adenosyltransferase, partial [Candidatus Acidiferrales bacterium]